MDDPSSESTDGSPPREAIVTSIASDPGESSVLPAQRPHRRPRALSSPFVLTEQESRSSGPLRALHEFMTTGSGSRYVQSIPTLLTKSDFEEIIGDHMLGPQVRLLNFHENNFFFVVCT